MLDLSSVSREREVLSAVADAIVAAAAGRGLRVAVSCPDSYLVFVGQLARALHARGRPCRCLVSRPNPSVAGSPWDHGEAESTLAVITSEPFAQTDDDVQRVNIDVIAGDLTGPGGAVTHRQAAYGDPNAGNEQDIILEYHDSDGWIIRHIAPYLFRSPG